MSSAHDLFQTGALFADRYRMITRIGRGGMGDVWRADDLVLETPVALKLIDSTDADARMRVLNEVRLARQITHPAVCRVFDIGESGGHVFFTMELIDGEDLASLLSHAGRLPSEKVLEIAHQLCAGLAAAHACGVLHRDLKPANVLIDDRGQVRITDFGIATTRTDKTRHTLIGTPGYMAPEQETQGTPLTERTDIYALGLVLYELLTGEHVLESIDANGIPRPPSAIVTSVDLRLERAVLHAIAADPRNRPASAAALAASLPPIAGTPPSRRGPRRGVAATALAATALVVLAAALGWTLRSRPAGASLNAQDTVVLADFANSTGDAVFDGTLAVALAVALEQSPFLKVFPEDRVREALTLMGRSRDEPVTRPIAREIARREQLKALLAGSIAGLGTNYVIALEAINAESGEVMAREQVEATSKEGVLGALGRAAARLREKLGESLASVEKYDVVLPRATTASLEALQAYARALDEGRVNPTREAIPQLKRAIELDPDFAMAHAMLSGMYANIGQSSLAPEFSTRAFALRDRVSERERFYISWRYYRDALQAWDKGLELARSWAATYPRETLAFNSIGFAATTLGQFEAALAPLREAIRLDPKYVAPPENLGTALIALNRFDEAKSVLADTRTHQKYFVAHGRLAYLISLIEGDAPAMARHLKEAEDLPDPSWASNWRPRTSAFFGRLGTAHTEFSRASQAIAPRDPEMAAHLLAQDAESHAFVSQCDDARREAGAAFALSRDNFTIERMGRALAICGSDAEASRLADELARRFPEATMTTQVAIPIIRAAVALDRNDAQRALDLLEPVRPYDHVPSAEFWSLFLRGQARLKLRDAARARAEFQTILEHRGDTPDAMLYPLAQLELARAVVLGGDVAAARAAYERFFASWKDADPALPQLQDARREFAALPSP